MLEERGAGGNLTPPLSARKFVPSAASGATQMQGPCALRGPAEHRFEWNATLPTVSVVTPFYNTDEYLEECIEGVLGQTLEDFEYVLVDNASTDESLEIARAYEARDPRIRILHFDELLPQIPNYNRALRQVDPSASYCKIAQADDILLPRCLQAMVVRAESDPEIGLVGAYTILQNRVFLDGLDYFERVVEGNELCRRYLQDGPYLFGSPTSQLYRMADVQARDPFFPETGVIADADAAMDLVLDRRFGFVHETLTFIRTSNESITTTRGDFNIDALTRRVLLEKYGRRVMDEETFRRWRGILARRHYRVLGEGWLKRLGPKFWAFHREGMTDAGLEISRMGVAMGAAAVLFRYPLNLEQTMRELWRWIRGGDGKG